ncbi:hypothetical protein BJ741DRAFT_91739 [Chytriomyces cf. hyalinus JEL632]|nr:hypothetical protein BJ741DRAFT_91739 [Chytriomyces cf. hyalinus JEL632]
MLTAQERLRTQLELHRAQCITLEDRLNNSVDIVEIEMLDAALLQEEARFNRIAAALMRIVAEDQSRQSHEEQMVEEEASGSPIREDAPPSDSTATNKNVHLAHIAKSLRHANSLPLPAIRHAADDQGHSIISSLSVQEVTQHTLTKPVAIPLSSSNVQQPQYQLSMSPSSTVSNSAPPDSWEIFVSYSWKNSREAFENGQTQSDEGCGSCDPRLLARKLTGIGHVTWLDSDRLDGGEPLYQTLVNAITPAKFIVVCVSDEYALSKSCNLEWNYLNDRNIPYVILFVGTHKYKDWDNSVLKFMAGNSVYIEAFGPKETPLSDAVFNRIANAVKKGLSHAHKPQTLPGIGASTLLQSPPSPREESQSTESVVVAAETEDTEEKEADLTRRVSLWRQLW